MGCTASKSAGFTPRLPLETQPHPPSAFGHHVPVLLEPEKNASPFLVTKLSQEAGFGTVADGPAVVSSSTVNTTPKELEVSGVAPHAEDAKNAIRSQRGVEAQSDAMAAPKEALSHVTSREGFSAAGPAEQHPCSSASKIKLEKKEQQPVVEGSVPKEPIVTSSALEPPVALGRTVSTVCSAAPAQDKTATERNLSTCRLKKFTNISDVYDISSQVLGTGISGAVRLANHKLSGRRYAIKTLSLEGVNAKRTAMLHNEVSIYLQLDHPNIAKLIEVYESDRAIHLVMELCTDDGELLCVWLTSGGELYDRLAAKKKYSESDAAKVAQQMLSAINYCHQHRICHRDLKLENWVYADSSPDAPLKLIDFGFSRIFNPGVPMTAMHGTVYYVSPEVMDGCYQEKCDIWSIGVIVYMLLSGSPPFNGSYDHEILIKIKRGAFNFTGPRWEGISSCAKSFIAFLLQKDPDQRPSAEEALQHSWLQREDTADHDIDLSVVKSMRDFALGNILRRAALGVVALGMTSQEVAALETVFRQLDKSNRGTIQLQDLANVLREKLNVNDTEAQRIFERIDQTGKREVHYSEFIAATLQAKFIKDDRLIKEAFQRFDVDNNQRITLENLRSVLGDSYNGSRVEDILRLCDSNGDGYIDYHEFYKALTSDETVLNEHGSDVLNPKLNTTLLPFSTSISENQGCTILDKRSRESEQAAGSVAVRHSFDFLEDCSKKDLLFRDNDRSSRKATQDEAAAAVSPESAFNALQSMRKATTCLRAAAAAKSVRVDHAFIAQNTS